MKKFTDFKNKVYEKMNECKALMETQPMTEQLAENIEETVGMLLDEFEALEKSGVFNNMASEPKLFLLNVLSPWFQMVRQTRNNIISWRNMLGVAQYYTTI